MAKKEFAPGLPDPKRFGRLATLPKKTPLAWVIQRHLAERAGPHYDVRFGPDRGTKPSLFSWAAKRLPTEPGQKTLLFRQPLHTGQYADFEGTIASGYGKGVVKTHDKGRVLVTHVSPDKVKFAVIHKKHPETFALVRKSGPPVDPKTAREKRTQGGTWLMVNTTPTEAIKNNKVHYAKVPAADVQKLFDEDYLHQEKIDGAAALYKLFSDRIEVLSYRPTTQGRPIIHTYRVGGTTGVNIPKHLVGTLLRGELYGVRKGTEQAIPPQELGGILNASTLRSIQKQQEQKVELRNAIFNVLRYGKQQQIPITSPLAGRMEKLKEILGHLPAPKFHLPRMAGTPEEQQQMWQEISQGKWPRTREGIVAWPRAGGRPTKVKLYQEHDVHVASIFPGQGALQGVGAGGFKYSLKPGGKGVGEVGTGFSAETRRRMHEQPEEYTGRVARIQAQSQFPSGAFRAPSYLGLHEDYPAVLKAAALRMRLWPTAKSTRIQGLKKEGAAVSAGTLTAMIRQATKALGGEGETLADFAKVAGVPQVATPEISPALQQALQQAQGGTPTLGDRLRGLMLGMQPQQIVHLRSGLSGMSKAVETVKALAEKLQSQSQPPRSVRTPPVR